MKAEYCCSMTTEGRFYAQCQLGDVVYIAWVEKAIHGCCNGHESKFERGTIVSRSFYTLIMLSQFRWLTTLVVR